MAMRRVWRWRGDEKPRNGTHLQKLCLSFKLVPTHDYTRTIQEDFVKFAAFVVYLELSMIFVSSSFWSTVGVMAIIFKH